MIISLNHESKFQLLYNINNNLDRIRENNYAIDDLVTYFRNLNQNQEYF